MHRPESDDPGRHIERREERKKGVDGMSKTQQEHDMPTSPPLSTKRKSVGKMVDEATMWERVCTMLKKLAEEVNREHREHLKGGSPDDPSFDATLAYLNESIAHATGCCNEAWSAVYSNAKVHRQSVRELADAVILQAVMDYEHGLCKGGRDGEHTVAEVEKFAKTSADNYAAINFASVLKRIKRVYPEFQKLVREHGADIVVDTKYIKRKKHPEYNTAKYRCPLCGGGVYEKGNPVGNVHKIICEGCYLEGWYIEKETY